MESPCGGECGRQEWRYCPHCGRPLAPGRGRARRTPTVEEYAHLRAERRSWKQIGALFGYPTGAQVKSALTKMIGEWYHRSKYLLARAYREGGGDLREPRYPTYPGGGYQRPTAAELREYQERRDAYEEARERWADAIDLGPIETLTYKEDDWLREAVLGKLPGPLPRWPEPE